MGDRRRQVVPEQRLHSAITMVVEQRRKHRVRRPQLASVSKDGHQPVSSNILDQTEHETSGCADLLNEQADATKVCKVLILGGGFGGTYAALEFERILSRGCNVDVTLVTRDNYFLFTPMLHEVAASDLEMNAIVNPLRKLLRRVKTFTGSIETIDLQKRCVAVSH